MSEEFRAIKPGELEECLDLWGIVFERVGRGYFPPYFQGDPWFRRAYTRVCAVDGKLVSTVQICERRVRVGNTELVMGGIGNVATLAEYRGRGYSQRLLSDCARVMQERGIDFSVLFTGIQPFYEKVLWRSVPQRMLNGIIRADLPKHDTRYATRVCDWSADLGAIRRIYDEFNAGRSFTTIRTPEYWTGYLPQRLGKPEFTLVAEDSHGVVGYVFYGRDAPNLWVKEIGWLPGHGACVQPLIRKVAKRARESGCESLHANLPHEPEVLSAIGEVAAKVEPREPMGMMCRITNMRSLSRRLLPEIARRARESCVSDCALSLDTELGSLRFTVRHGAATLGAENPIRIPMSQLEFFCLLFGIKSAAELGMSIPGGARKIVEKLFPPGPFVFWLADHF